MDQADMALPAAEKATRSPLRTFLLKVLAALRFKKARAALQNADAATKPTTAPDLESAEAPSETTPQETTMPQETAVKAGPAPAKDRGALLERVDSAVKKKQAAQRKAVPLPRLLAAMQHQDEKVRISAIKRLAYMDEDQAVNALLNALADESHLVGRAALQALKFIGQRAIPGLLSLLNGSNVNSRGAAIEALGEIGDHAAVPALLQCLNDTTKPWLADLRICDIAAEALTAIGNPEAAAAVEAWHKANHEKAALNGNGAAIDSPAEPPAGSDAPPVHRDILSELLSQLQHEDWQTRQQGAKSLRDYAHEMHGIKDRAVLAKLWQTITSDDWVVRWASAEALAWIGDYGSVPKITPLLDDPNWTVRIAGIRALLEIGDPRAADAVLKKLDDANNNVREAAAEAIGVLGSALIIPRLEYALLDDESFVRLAVVNALGNIGGAEVIQPLMRALSDNDANVRWAAAGALIEHHNEDTIPALLEHLEDTGGPYWEGSRICDRVAEALEKIGTPEALAAVEAWREGDED